ncbi:MAG: mechanosensitive ion channel domain-containing protein, partial [Cyanobacteria bacterium P01_D01_bin.56]
MFSFVGSILAPAEAGYWLRIGLPAVAVISVLFSIGHFGSILLSYALKYAKTERVGEFYSRVIQPRQTLLKAVTTVGLFNIALWLLFRVCLNATWYASLETLSTLMFTLSFGWLLSRLFKEYFDSYVLGAATRQGQKANSELLILGRFFTNFGIIISLAIIFGQTHNFNVFGLVASLGVGGIAIAFAAQKVLEQLLGGVVIYIDRPFSIDDYIGLPDGTYGRVESIGLRSTKVRTSGKGTLAIVPNNAIIQSTVENFTGAKKVMALLYLTFHKNISMNEQALIRQVVLNSTQDVIGIDSRGTDISFKQDA